ncbi:MAG TPA: hypothetical protein PKA20_30640, partial [Burkholderiaceae bacterium]|nr:hypothetical protein [Burkholderiaceae bacterium]
LVDYDERRFGEIVEGFPPVVDGMGFDEVQAIPVSALRGDMVVERGESLGWYDGPTLLEYLEQVPSRHEALAGRGGGGNGARGRGADGIAGHADRAALRLPVQRVVRVPLGAAQPGSGYEAVEFRGYQGTIAAGGIAVGDEVVVLPGAQTARVASLLLADRAVQRAEADQAVTVSLDRELDVSRGSLIVSAGDVPVPARSVDAQLCWFDDEPLDVSRRYRIKHATQTVLARIGRPHYRIDVETLQRIDGPEHFGINDIGRVPLTVQQPLAFEPYERNRVTGAFIVIDEATNRTVAAGTVA